MATQTTNSAVSAIRKELRKIDSSLKKLITKIPDKGKKTRLSDAMTHVRAAGIQIAILQAQG